MLLIDYIPEVSVNARSRNELAVDVAMLPTRRADHTYTTLIGAETRKLHQ